MLKTLKIAISIGMMSGTFKELKMLNNPNTMINNKLDRIVLTGIAILVILHIIALTIRIL
tara:strand:- start:1938 stop:2117 length:180 start_codon:yes stop_codon:yes gene_type:complete